MGASPYIDDDDRKRDFLEAFVKMQDDLPLIEKGAKGFNYKYAPLEKLLEKWTPVFRKHNFLMRTRCVANGDRDVVSTLLTHIPTGYTEDSSLTLPISSDYQSVGSGLTYYRRYTLVCVTGQQPVGEDWDGLKPVRPEGKKPKRKTAEETKSKEVEKEDVWAYLSSESGPVENGRDDTGIHIAVAEFAKACNTVRDLTNYWRKNKDELNKLNELHPGKYNKAVEAFSNRKAEILTGIKEGK